MCQENVPTQKMLWKILAVQQPILAQVSSCILLMRFPLFIFLVGYLSRPPLFPHLAGGIVRGFLCPDHSGEGRGPGGESQNPPQSEAWTLGDTWTQFQLTLGVNFCGRFRGLLVDECWWYMLIIVNSYMMILIFWWCWRFDADIAFQKGTIDYWWIWILTSQWHSSRVWMRRRELG